MKNSMSGLAFAVATLGIAGSAAAEIPFVNASCPTGIDVHADEGGPVYINGNEATVKTFGDAVYEATHGDTTIELMAEVGGGVSVTYTGPGGANGVCRVAASDIGEPAPGECPVDVSEADRASYPACN